jgi:pyruvate/2-oxoacid:ferredoxin oxidoreductase alpha subunit
MKSPLRGSGRQKENPEYLRDRAAAYKAVAVELFTLANGDVFTPEQVDEEIEEWADRKFVAGIPR